MSISTECAWPTRPASPTRRGHVHGLRLLEDRRAPVTWDEIVRIFKDNAEKVTTLLIETIKAL
jgi:hypothetical protein